MVERPENKKWVAFDWRENFFSNKRDFGILEHLKNCHSQKCVGNLPPTHFILHLYDFFECSQIMKSLINCLACNTNLRSKKAGRFEKLLDFGRSHSIAVSRTPPHRTLPGFLNLHGTFLSEEKIWRSEKRLIPYNKRT